MTTERLLQLFQGKDIGVWPVLCREIERRSDVEAAAQALALCCAQGQALSAASWLAHVEQTQALQHLRHALLSHAHRWPINPMRALAKDILSADFRLIPAGQFVMGSPKRELGRGHHENQFRVEITQPFLMKTTPVTQAEWQALMGNNPSQFQSDSRRPVESVTWYDALAFCQHLCEREGLSGCYDLSGAQGTPGTQGYTCPVIRHFNASASGYRLPTEAEWEYAARAGTTTPFYNGEITQTTCGLDPNLDAIGWYCGNADQTTHPVRSKNPNAWGLYDIIGNVWEWVWDWKGVYPTQPQRDPTGYPQSPERALRGGSWFNHAKSARAASRSGFEPHQRSPSLGFRPVRAFV